MYGTADAEATAKSMCVDAAELTQVYSTGACSTDAPSRETHPDRWSSIGDWLKSPRTTQGNCKA
eukprot:7454781-Pyramimonas_sp.AAC.1